MAYKLVRLSDSKLAKEPWAAKLPGEPIIWETRNVSQLRSVLVQKEADVVALKAQLTGDSAIDWYALNSIRTLEAHIGDIRKWLRQAQGGTQ